MNDVRLILVTCTRNRPEAFAICAEYVSRSTRKPDRWIIVSDGDDGDAPLQAAKAACPDLDIRFARRFRTDGEPAHSLPLNLMAAFSFIERPDPRDVVVFWEDDDWYSPAYLEHIAEFFSANPAILLYGQSKALYYRLQAREWAQLPNEFHAGLCATAFRPTPEMLVAFQFAVADIANPFVDIRLWNYIASERKRLTPHLFVVGIKQAPGTPSTTLGWKGGDIFHPDVMDSVLPVWVGAEDALRYRRLTEVDHVAQG